MTATSDSAVPNATPARTSAWIDGRGWLLLATAVTLLAVGDQIRRSLSQMLWLDELYTTTLISTDRLSHLWQAILQGMDGNPPLYLTLAWLVTHGTGLAPELVLRLLNLALIGGACVLQYRIAGRIAGPVAAGVALLLVSVLEVMPIFAVLELRTYALYLCAVSATLLAALRLGEQPHLAGRSATFAATGAVSALAHTYGGFYVVAVATALLLVAEIGGSRVVRRRVLLCTLPAVAISGLWLSVYWPAMKATANPYSWFTAPDLPDLVFSLTGSLQITPVAVVALAVLGFLQRRRLPLLVPWIRARPATATLFLALAGFAGLTTAFWIVSRVAMPCFTFRYFIPNVTIAVVLVAAFVESLGRVLSRRGVLLVALLALAGSTAAIASGRYSGSANIPCITPSGGLLQADGADRLLPVVSESPHGWMPRDRYAAGPNLYPLDWEVVLGYPLKARNNAMDYQLMRILRDWLDPGDRRVQELLTTDEILARYPQFVVANEEDRSWFDHLRATHPLTATLLKQENGCRLWRVQMTPAP